MEVSGPLQSELSAVKRAVEVLDKILAAGAPWDELEEVVEEIRTARDAIDRANTIMRGGMWGKDVRGG